MTASPQGEAYGIQQYSVSFPLKMGETNESATFKTFPLFTFPEYGNHICIANMILKGACTNLLKEKFSRTFGEKVACVARRMRCSLRQQALYKL